MRAEASNTFYGPDSDLEERRAPESTPRTGLPLLSTLRAWASRVARNVQTGICAAEGPYPHVRALLSDLLPLAERMPRPTASRPRRSPGSAEEEPTRAASITDTSASRWGLGLLLVACTILCGVRSGPAISRTPAAQPAPIGSEDGTGAAKRLGADVRSPRPDTADWFGREQLDTAVLPPGTDADREEGRNLTTASRQVFRKTNEVRASRGRSTLEPEATLSRIACRHNKDMMAHDYMAHEDSEGRGPTQRIAREHRRALVVASGENVLWNYNPQTGGRALGAQFVESWMDSPGHRENILTPKFTHLGACVTQQQDTVRATQVFAKIEGYLDAPIPWSVTAGDSLQVSVTLLRSDLDLDRYSMSRVGRGNDVTFQDMHRFEGMLYYPASPGLYTVHFWSAHLTKQEVRYEGVAGGPYFEVQRP